MHRKQQHVFGGGGGGGGGSRSCWADTSMCQMLARWYSTIVCVGARQYLDCHHDIWAELVDTPSDVLHVKLLWQTLYQVIKHLQKDETRLHDVAEALACEEHQRRSLSAHKLECAAQNCPAI